MATAAPDLAKAVGDEEQREYTKPATTGARFADGQSLSEFTTNASEKGGSSGYASSTIGLDHAEVSKHAEKRLVRKLDRLILPLAVLLYLSANLDRVLDNNPTKYSLALCSFFITYHRFSIIFNIPGILAAKRFPPSRTIAFGAYLWSTAATCQGAVQNAPGLYVCRLLVGIGESFFGNAIAFYLSLWYRQTELAKRIGLYIGAGSLAGATGGLIAYGVAQIAHPAIATWRVLFLIEGLPCLLLAIVVFFILPNRPDNTRYLNKDEQLLACTRLNSENNSSRAVEIDWRAVHYAVLDWRNLLLSVAYSCMNLSLASVSGFLPTIIKGLGYSNANAQLYSVPPYACSLAVMLIATTLSDRLKSRGVFVMAVFAISILGWALLLGVDPIGVSHAGLRLRYFAVCCVTATGASNGPIMMAWISRNNASESARATGFGLLNSVGQVMSIVAAFLFPAPEGPRFRKGAATNLAFASLGLCIAFLLTCYFRLENRRRDEREGGRPPADLPIENIDTEYDRAVGFRYAV
ncbi:hypothetical protein JCM10908_005762 [Rhodotorula pacifica]|uniref:uncharacterized protein n=1 Tax=Rhodotorula pacifica TaxID=1495444 RepID=UPI00316F4D4F